MRSLGSISSELCEMQRLRDKNIALGVKDAEWQRRITLARGSPQQNDMMVTGASMLSPTRRPLTLDQSQFNPNPYANRDSRVFAVSSPQKTGMASLPTYATAPPVAGQLNYAIPVLRTTPMGVPMPVDAQSVRPDVFDSSKVEPTLMDMSKISSQELLNPPDMAEQIPRPGWPPSPGGGSSTPSASTHAHSPELDDPVDTRKGLRKKPRSHTRGVGKIRRHRMTKEEEARFDPRDLADLRGSTAAQSRKMSDQQRDVMLHKRRLRNRQSAARSRDKQRKTISEVGEEVDELLAQTEDVKMRCQKAMEESADLRAANESMRRENEELKEEITELKQTNAELKQANAVSQSPAMRRSGSTLKFSFSTDMLDKLDKIIGGSADGIIPSSGEASNIYRIPSKLRLSLSTDKLTDGFPATSGTLPPLSRNTSILDRLLDYANNNNCNNNNIDSLDANTDVEVKKE